MSFEQKSFGQNSLKLVFETKALKMTSHLNKNHLNKRHASKSNLNKCLGKNTLKLSFKQIGLKKSHLNKFG
jgi:hypothetical protein